MNSVDKSWVRCVNGLNVKVPLDLRGLQESLSIHLRHRRNRCFKGWITIVKLLMVTVRR